MNAPQMPLAIDPSQPGTAVAPAGAVVVEGTEARATSPEGHTAAMPLEALLAKISPPRPCTGEAILPDGIKAVLSDGPLFLWIHETPPQIYQFEWIAEDSPAPYGPGAVYRPVRIALPYLIIVAVWLRRGSGQYHLSANNECFFRTAPLRSLDDDLCYPALLNCSKFHNPEGRPLAWICTQHLRPNAAMRSADANVRLRAGFEALRRCLMETKWNYSSEHHEGSSWFTESRRVDPRVRSIDAWQEASARDALFVLDVPWLPTGHSVRQTARRIFAYMQVPRPAPASAAAWSRLIFNQ